MDNESMQFECSYCNFQWSSDRKDYKIRIVKTNNKYWKLCTAICPKCGRETSITISIEHKPFRKLFY